MMSSEIKHGFLGDEYYVQYEHIQKKYNSYFDLSWRLNTLSHSLLNQMNDKIQKDDARLVIVASLYMKSMSSFQGIIFLLSKGMQKEVNILLRTFIEVFFWLKAINSHSRNYELYILHGECKRISSAENILKHDIEMHSDFGGKDKLKKRIKHYKDTYEQLKKEYGYTNSQIDNFNKPYKIAEAGGVSRFFVNIYSLLSNDVHSNSLCVGDYLTVDDENNIQRIDYGPSEDGIERSFDASIGMLLQVCEVICNEFGLTNYLPELEEIEKELFHISNMTDLI